MAVNSPQVRQLKALQEMANHSLQAQKTAELEKNTPPPQNNTGLPDTLKSGIETLSGLSMDNFKVHYNSSQPAQLNALAYAQGTDIHIAPGQEQHLPHEAWHLVQQAQSRVRPTMQLKDGVPVNDDKGLEREADVMGRAKAISSNNTSLVGPPLSTHPNQLQAMTPLMHLQQISGSQSQPVIQRWYEKQQNDLDRVEKARKAHGGITLKNRKDKDEKAAKEKLLSDLNTAWKPLKVHFEKTGVLPSIEGEKLDELRKVLNQAIAAIDKKIKEQSQPLKAALKEIKKQTTEELETDLKKLVDITKVKNWPTEPPSDQWQASAIRIAKDKSDGGLEELKKNTTKLHHRPGPSKLHSIWSTRDGDIRPLTQKITFIGLFHIGLDKRFRRLRADS